jgi:hypothetical protein
MDSAPVVRVLPDRVCRHAPITERMRKTAPIPTGSVLPHRMVWLLGGLVQPASANCRF